MDNESARGSFASDWDQRENIDPESFGRSVDNQSEGLSSEHQGQEDDHLREDQAANLSSRSSVSSETEEVLPSEDQVDQSSNHQNDQADQSENGDNPDSNSEGNDWLTYSELMLDSYPAKSKIIYLKAYKMFERFLKSKKQFVANVAPTEIQILNYFYFLKHEKNLAPTTLWSTYSRVNACVKRLYGFSLKNFVRVTDVLKSYESGYKVKKASIFMPQEVYQLK